MLNKTIVPIALALWVALTGSACTKLEISATEPVKQPVEVIEAKVEELSLTRMYLARISADSNERLSFMASGKIAELNVKAGAAVKKGQLLARLENQAQASGVNSSSAQIRVAEEVAAKAQRSLTHLEKSLEDMKVLYDQGAIPKSELEGLMLQVDLTRADLKAAQAQVQAAKAGYSLSSSYLKDTKLTAPRAGVVLDVFYKKGDLVSAGYPVLMLEGQTHTAVFGISSETLLENAFSMDVEVIYDGQPLAGKISKIDKLPDPQTQSYEVEVTLPQGQYLIGAQTEVHLKLGQVRAVSLPIDIVLSGENDFVYVVESGKAIKKNVDILAVEGNRLYVDGLTDGDQIIVKGMKLVNPLDDVEIVETTR